MRNGRNTVCDSRMSSVVVDVAFFYIRTAYCGDRKSSVLAKSVGSNNPQNLVRATIKGLQSVQSPETVAIKRGKSVEDIMANVGGATLG